MSNIGTQWGHCSVNHWCRFSLFILYLCSEGSGEGGGEDGGEDGGEQNLWCFLIHLLQKLKIIFTAK